MLSLILTCASVRVSAMCTKEGMVGFSAKVKILNTTPLECPCRAGLNNKVGSGIIKKGWCWVEFIDESDVVKATSKFLMRRYRKKYFGEEKFCKLLPGDIVELEIKPASGCYDTPSYKSDSIKRCSQKSEIDPENCLYSHFKIEKRAVLKRVISKVERPSLIGKAVDWVKEKVTSGQDSSGPNSKKIEPGKVYGNKSCSKEGSGGATVGIRSGELGGGGQLVDEKGNVILDGPVRITIVTWKSETPKFKPEYLYIRGKKILGNFDRISIKNGAATVVILDDRIIVKDLKPSFRKSSLAKIIDKRNLSRSDQEIEDRQLQAKCALSEMAKDIKGEIYNCLLDPWRAHNFAGQSVYTAG